MADIAALQKLLDPLFPGLMGVRLVMPGPPLWAHGWKGNSCAAGVVPRGAGALPSDLGLTPRMPSPPSGLTAQQYFRYKAILRGDYGRSPELQKVFPFNSTMYVTDNPTIAANTGTGCRHAPKISCRPRASQASL